MTAPKKQAKRVAPVASVAPSGPSSAPASMPSLPSGESLQSIAPEMKQYESSAAKLGAKSDTSTECQGFGLAEGEGYCYSDSSTSYIVFCDGGSAYALDCTTFGENVACGEEEDSVACEDVPSTKVADDLVADLSYAVPIGWCAPQTELAAGCDDDYVEFCKDGVFYQLDCTSYVNDQGEAATCGELDSVINCGFDE
jgi:hypothetical protein